MASDLFKINQIIALITAVLLVIFSGFLLTVNKERKPNRLLLFIFLVINAAYLIGFLVISNLKPHTTLIVSIFYLLHSSGFLFGPVIFLYTKLTVGAIYMIGIKDLIHLVPFCCALFYIFFTYGIFGDPNKIWNQTDRMIIDLVLNLQVMLYVIFSLIEVKKYRNRLRNYYSSIEKLNFYWLSIVLYGFFFMWVADFINFILRRLFILPTEVHTFIVTLSILTNFIFAVLIFYEGFKRPQFFHLPEQSEEKPKYEKSKLTKEENDLILNKLSAFMEKEKPYLDPVLTLSGLAKKVDASPRHLSQVINDSLNKNFYDFINSYRVNESLKYLAGSGNNRKTILEILYESGFNSKSTFYKVFKDLTGESPTGFKNRKNLHDEIKK
jgi:AraC-like DNA-binding protein